jgi:Lrp/AsnC family leucine-responsive transcriptional regulator
MSISAKPALDRIDRRILDELQADARLPNVALADRVGLSPSPCLRRVKLLEAAGTIEGYRTILDRRSVDLGLTVFAGIRVERHSDANADSFVDAVLAMPEVLACHLVSGDVDFLIEIVVPDMQTYESTVLRRFLSLPAVRDIRSNFAMRTHRANSALPIRLE